MALFSAQDSAVDNLLPADGIVRYYGPLMPTASADDYFNRLMTGIDWQPDEAFIYGKHIITKRKVAWHADQPFSYTYSRTTKHAAPWTSELLELKSMVENRTGETFNSCLLNLYHNGSEGMAWHSDSEKELKLNGAIGSLSFGAERKFCFKHKASKETVAVMLAHGSLLVMQGTTQTHWQHRLPPTKKISEPRINLTFRSMNTNRQAC